MTTPPHQKIAQSFSLYVKSPTQMVAANVGKIVTNLQKLGAHKMTASELGAVHGLRKLRAHSPGK